MFIYLLMKLTTKTKAITILWFLFILDCINLVGGIFHKHWGVIAAYFL